MTQPLSACRRTFLGDVPQPWLLPITSVSESRLLTELGLPAAEQNQILGLRIGRAKPASGANIWGLWLTEQQISSRAIVRLANNPPPEVGRLQRLTSKRLLRPFPLGLRLSGKNMSPLPCWLSGAQSVALNMSNNDLAVHLHFALFNGSKGFVLKPPGMLGHLSDAADADGNTDEDYWPPPCDQLHIATIDLLSLHNLVKVLSPIASGASPVTAPTLLSLVSMP